MPRFLIAVPPWHLIAAPSAGPHLPEHERLAALGAVIDTFQAAALTERDLFAQDLDASFLDRYRPTRYANTSPPSCDR